MSFVCHLYVPVNHSYVTCIYTCYPYVTKMHWFVIRSHSYVLIRHPYVTCMSPLCQSSVLVCHPYGTRMSSLCHPYVFVCHLYVTHIYSYVTRMSVVCGFAMNHMGSCTMNHMNMFYIIPEIFLLRLLRSKKDRRSICYVCPQIIENKWKNKVQIRTW